MMVDLVMRLLRTMLARLSDYSYTVSLTSIRGKVEHLNTRMVQKMKCLPNRCDLPTASRRSFADAASWNEVLTSN